MSENLNLAGWVVQHLESGGIDVTDQPVVIGCSGGVDSVVLLDLLCELGALPIVAHVNYGLRGDDSNQDEQHVREMCARIDVPCVVERPSPGEMSGDDSMQAVARKIRYNVFHSVAEKHDARFVAVAHHREDQAETVLLNMFRGAGIEGLAGMPLRRPIAPGATVELVRPLLLVGREEIIAYAQSRALVWRDDASNRDLRFARVRVRDHVLPAVVKHFGQAAVNNISQTAELVFQYLEHTHKDELESRFASVVVSDEPAFDVEMLGAQPPVWRSRLVLEGLKRWIPSAPIDAATADRISDLLTSQPGRREKTGTGAVWRDRHALYFAAEACGASTVSLALEMGSALPIADGILRLDELRTPVRDLDPLTRNVAFVDLDAIGDLNVRFWRDGDRVTPLGGSHAKKVSDVLTNAHVPSHKRSGVAVVESDGEILWVVGVRQSHYGRVREVTRRVGMLTFVPDR